MAGYNHPNGGMPNNHNNGRLAGLNGLPSDYEIALQQQRAAGFDNNAGYDFQADLDMFTNTQFFDFEMAEMPETNSPHNGPADDSWALNTGFLGAQSNTHQPPNFNAYNNARQHHPYPIYPTTTASTTPSSLASPTTRPEQSKTRQHSQLELPSNMDTTLEDASREATEEDKRRRNTAASARFRVKKKQREQALEKTAKDMTDRVTYLEQRVQNLEMENKLLKDLITEKSGIVPNVSEKALEEKLEGSKAQKATPGKRKEVKIETKAAATS